MVAAEIGSFVLYAVSMAFLPQYFGMLASLPLSLRIRVSDPRADLNFVLSWRFFWKVAIIVGRCLILR